MSATPTSWHLDDPLSRRYASDELDAVTAASVETHLLRCADCRAAIAAAGPAPERLDALWAEVVDRIDAPRVTLVERVLRRVGVRDGEARLLAATPSLQVSWFAALLLVLGFAVGAAFGVDREGVLFLLVAPLLPVAGVGWAYGPAVDPAHEIGVAAPYSGTRLLLLRAASVLTTSVVIAASAGSLLPSTGWGPAAWLLPSLALTAVTLAATTRFSAAVSAGGVAAGWLVVVTQLARYDRAVDAVGATAQVVAVVALAVSLAVLAARLDRLDLGSPA